VPEVFAYWLQAGRVDVGFLSAAQIDRFGNLNTTVIGGYEEPDVRLPGAGGAPEIASSAREVIVMLRHRRRAFVPEVDFVTSVGFGRRGEGRAGHRGAGPTVVITDLGVLEPDPATYELRLAAVHPGVDVDQVRAETGWDLRISEDLSVTDPPSPDELEVLRALKARTEAAHAG
jgi:glutaconate CoA-transferase subunit B